MAEGIELGVAVSPPPGVAVAETAVGERGEETVAVAKTVDVGAAMSVGIGERIGVGTDCVEVGVAEIEGTPEEPHAANTPASSTSHSRFRHPLTLSSPQSPTAIPRTAATAMPHSLSRETVRQRSKRGKGAQEFGIHMEARGVHRTAARSFTLLTSRRAAWGPAHRGPVRGRAPDCFDDDPIAIAVCRYSHKVHASVKIFFCFCRQEVKFLCA